MRLRQREEDIVPGVNTVQFDLRRTGIAQCKGVPVLTRQHLLTLVPCLRSGCACWHTNQATRLAMKRSRGTQCHGKQHR